MSQTINITLKAIDDASGAIATAGNSIKNSLGGVTEASNSVAVAQQKVTTSSKDQIVGFSGLATAGFSLYQGFDRIEASSVALHRANLNVQRSTEALDKAEKAVTVALQKHGAGSQEVKDATDKLSIAEEALTVAEERQGLAQNNNSNTMISFGLMIIPTAITAVAGLGTAFTALGLTGGIASAGIDLITMAMATLAAHPIILVIMGIIAAIVLLWNYCPPVRDAIIAVGVALGEGLKWACDTVIGALTWLWNNVLKPIADFLGATFLPIINAVAGALGWVAGVVGGAWDSLVLSVELATKSWEQIVTDAMNAQLKAVEEGMANQIAAVKSGMEKQLFDENNAYDKMTKDALKFWGDFVDPPKDAWQKIIDSVGGKYDKQIEDLNKWAADEKEAINKHYDDQIADVNDKYAKQLDDTNRYYDDLIALTQNKLTEIQVGRTKDLDHLELEYLRRKKVIEDSTAAEGASADEIVAFNENKSAKLKELEDMYRKIRGEMTEGYRLKELEAEEANSANVEAVNEKRASAVSKIEANQAAEIKKLSDEKGATILRVEKETNDMVEFYQTERRDMVAAICSQQRDIETQHQFLMQNIIWAGEERQKQIIAQAEVDKQNIRDAAAARQTGTPAPAPVVYTPVPIESAQHKLAVAAIQASGLLLHWSAAFIAERIAAIPFMAEGGIAYSPTLAVIGESGPEAVVPLNRGGGGLGSVTYHVPITIIVEGSVDERTLAVLRGELKSVVVEATSASGPTNLKRMRRGNMF